MKKYNFLQIFGFIVELFAFVALFISVINDSPRLHFYLLFFAGAILSIIGSFIKRNKK